MATQVQQRRGTTAQHNVFTGANGEVTVDTSKDTLVIHDGTTQGGFPLAKEASVLPLAGGTMTGTISNFTSTGIDDNATSTAITIDSSERIGIGTSNPGQNLHVSASTDTRIALENTSNRRYDLISGDSGEFRIWDTAVGERMRIDSSGNVGIGTTAPTAPIHINSASHPQVKFGGSNALYYWGLDREASAGDLAFTNANGGAETERMRITSAGNVGIGTPSPSAKLQSSSNTFNAGSTTTGNPAIASQGYYGGAICLIDTKQSGMYAFNGGTRVSFFTGRVNGTHSAASKVSMTISDNRYVGFGVTSPTTMIHLNGGTAGPTNSAIAAAWNVHSDYRLKDNVVPMVGAIDRLKNLKPCRFNWNFEEGTPAVDGFLAHEVGEVVPEAESGTKDAMRDEEYEVTPAVMDGETVVTEAVMGTRSVPDYQGIDQSKLVPLLVASLQEAVATIEALEARVTALEPTI